MVADGTVVVEVGSARRRAAVLVGVVVVGGVAFSAAVGAAPFAPARSTVQLPAVAAAATSTTVPAVTSATVVASPAAAPPPTSPFDRSADDQSVLACLDAAGIDTDDRFLPVSPSGYPSPGALARVVSLCQSGFPSSAAG